nr:universal stress protein [Motiliproteus sediminis]
MRLVPVPLLLARPGKWTEAPRLLVAVDPLRAHGQPSGLDDAVLSASKGLALTLGGNLELLHSYQPLPAAVILDDALMMDFRRLQRRMAGEHREAMRAFVDRHSLAAETTVHLLEGEPAKEIARFANAQSVDVAALGIVDRSGIEDLILGSTAEALLDLVHCDLLIVPLPRDGRSVT